MDIGFDLVLINSEIFQSGLLKLLPPTITIMLLLYFAFKIIDMLLGLLKTWKNGNYKSKKMREGIVTWIAEIVAICFVLILDIVLGFKDLLSGFTLALFIYKETGSIMENLVECGVELPQVIASKLEIFNVKKEEENTTK